MVEFDRFQDNNDYIEEVVYVEQVDMHRRLRDDPTSDGRTLLHSGVFSTDLNFYDRESGQEWSVTLLKSMLDKKVVELEILPEDPEKRRLAIDAMYVRAKERHNIYLIDRIQRNLTAF